MIKNLVLSSGGVNGFFFIGALKYLIENNLLDNLESLLGTSVGSIIGFLYILGFNIKEIKKLIFNINPMELLNFNGENILKFIDNYGLDDGEKLIKIMRIVCKRKMLNPDITFKELYEKTNKKFIVSALNINKKKLIYFSYENYPNLEIFKAIRMSTSIPIIFQPYIFEKEIYVDGGAMDPCSLSYFKNKKETLGIMISTESKNITNFKEYLVTLFCNPIHKIIENYYDEPNIIIYKTKNKDGLNFNISENDILKIIEKGYKITKEEMVDILDFFKHTSH